MIIDISYEDKKKILKETFGMTSEQKINETIEETHDSEFYALYFDFIPVNK